MPKIPPEALAMFDDIQAYLIESKQTRRLCRAVLLSLVAASIKVDPDPVLKLRQAHCFLDQTFADPMFEPKEEPEEVDPFAGLDQSKIQ
jgi:hypothetical protein